MGTSGSISDSTSDFVCTSDWNHSVFIELVALGLTEAEAREATLSGYVVQDYGISLLGTVQRFPDGSPVIRPPVGYTSTSSGVFVRIVDDRPWNPAGMGPDGMPLPGYDDHGWPIGGGDVISVPTPVGGISLPDWEPDTAPAPDEEPTISPDWAAQIIAQEFLIDGQRRTVFPTNVAQPLGSRATVLINTMMLSNVEGYMSMRITVTDPQFRVAFAQDYQSPTKIQPRQKWGVLTGHTGDSFILDQVGLWKIKVQVRAGSRLVDLDVYDGALLFAGFAGDEEEAAAEEEEAGDGGRWGLAALVVVAVLAMARRK